jgi:hypothetical protein
MSDASALVKQAIEAYKAQDKDKAKELLLKAVDVDPQNEQAWMWMSAVVDTPEEQQICLENALKINPNNERAKKGLEVVNQKLASSGKRATSSPPATTSQPSAPAAYGSGREVSIPSPTELDSWIDGLGIASNQPSSSAPATEADPWASLSTPGTADDPWSGLGIGMDSSPSPSTPPSSAASAPPSPPADPWASIDTGGGTVDPFQASDPWGISTPTSSGSVTPFAGSSMSDWGVTEETLKSYDPFRSSDSWESQPTSGSPSPAAGADPWGSTGSGGTTSGGMFGRGTEESWGNVEEPPSRPATSYGSSSPSQSSARQYSSYDLGKESASSEFDFDAEEPAGSSYSGGSYSSGYYSFDDDEDELFASESDLSIGDDFADLDEEGDERYYALIPAELRAVETKGSNTGMILWVILLIVLNAVAAAALTIA